MRGIRLVNYLAGVSLAVFSYPALSQDIGSEISDFSDSGISQMQDGEIVVTAQRRAQKLRDVPVSVSVLGGGNLEKANISTLAQVSERVPGLKLSEPPVADVINIRGVGSSVNIGFEQSVGTFVDGVYRGRSRSARAALFDLERVEVLKGPQTTFFGNNTIAGALNITTRKPGHSFEANFTAFGAPAGEEYVLEGGISTPVTDELSVRVAGRWSGMGGYIKNTETGYDGPDRNDKIGRLSIAWEPSSVVSINARVDVGRMRARGQLNTALEHCGPDPVLGPPVGSCARYIAGVGLEEVQNQKKWTSPVGPGFFKLDYVELAMTTSVDVGAGDIILTTSYYDHDVDSMTDAHPIPSKYASLSNTTTGAAIRFMEGFHQFSQEARFQSRFSDVFELMAGAYYSHSKLNADSYFGLYALPLASLAPGFFAPGTPVSNDIKNYEKSETMSAFAAMTIHVAPRLRLNIGGRYTTVKKNDSRVLSFGSAGSIPGPETFVPAPGSEIILAPITGANLGDFANPSRRDSKFMPTAGIQFTPTSDIMLYGSYSKGFKAGGYSGFVSSAEFGPESVDAFEVGAKATLFDRLLDLNVAAFHAKYHDLQETVTVTTSIGAVAQSVGNVASSISKGVDFSATLRPMEGLSLTADIGYLDAYFVSYPGAPCTRAQSVTQPAPCSQDLSGRPRGFAPKWSGSVGVDYVFAVDNLEVRPAVNVYFSSSYFEDASADPFLRQSKYAKVDARIGVATDDGKWEVAVIGKNLTNKYTSVYRALVAAAGPANQVLPGQGRSIGAQLSLNF